METQRKRYMRAFMVIIVLGLASSVRGIGSTTARASSAGALVRRCYTNQLALAPVGSSGAAGTLAVEFRFQNRSARTCSLYGYPGILMYGKDGHRLTTHLRWSGEYVHGQRPRFVVLRPDTAAYFLLVWSDVPSGSGPCPLTTALRVTPPNTYTSVLLMSTALHGGFTACRGQITASPVLPTHLLD